jgi:eukaryotic-like serine/threonine-protein kinase
VALGVAGFLVFGRGSRTDAPAPAAMTSVTPAAAVAPSAPPGPRCAERMVEIPAGQFFQGSDAKDAQDNEKPAHNVELRAFCMDLYEVTAREYKACSDVGKCKRAYTEVEWPNVTPRERKTYSPLCTVDDADRADHPINCVTWEMAHGYCKAQGKRLPTEAEWEYATRGPDGRVYPWGDEEPTEKHLNACGQECAAWGRKHQQQLSPLYPADDGFPTTAPVGKFEAGKSRFGPYDVVGNVWEWVADWYGPYTADQKQNPTGPETGERRVIRGGGWNGEYATWLRPSFRYSQIPGYVSHGIGFRCASTL